MESRLGTNVRCAVSLRLLPFRLICSFFFLFSLVSLCFFFSHSQSRPWTPHSQSQNTQLLIQIIYLTITYNSYTYLRSQDSQSLRISQSLKNHKNPSHNLSRIKINLKNISKTSKNQGHFILVLPHLPASGGGTAWAYRVPTGQGHPRPHAV
jgi:hypothetical protein